MWKFGSLEILEYANDLYFSHIYLNWVVWKCESLETCKRALPFSHLSNFSQGWKILATQPWAPYRKGEQAPVTPKSVTGGKREGMGEKKLPRWRAATPQNVTRTCSKYMQECLHRRAHEIPAHMRMQKNCWLLGNTDAENGRPWPQGKLRKSDGTG